MEILTRIVPPGTALACAGCCVGSGVRYEIQGDAKPELCSVTLPIMRYKTHSDWPVHSFACGQVDVSGVAPKEVGTVAIPLSFCRTMVPGPRGWPGDSTKISVVFMADGKKMKHSACCSAYIHPRTHQLTYFIDLLP